MARFLIRLVRCDVSCKFCKILAPKMGIAETANKPASQLEPTARGVAKWRGTKKDSPVLTKYIRHGLIYAELKELFQKIFQKECFAGLTLKTNQTPMKIAICIKEPVEVIGENKFKLRQLQSMIAQRYGILPKGINIVFEKIADRGLEPAVHAETLRQCFEDSKPFKRAINSVMRSVKMAGGQGVVIKISGKVKGQRARSSRYASGLMITSGQPAKDYVRTAMAEAKCKQGVIGITVSVMLPFDPEGIRGPNKPLADKIVVLEPKSFD